MQKSILFDAEDANWYSSLTLTEAQGGLTVQAKAHGKHHAFHLNPYNARDLANSISEAIAKSRRNITLVNGGNLMRFSLVVTYTNADDLLPCGLSASISSDGFIAQILLSNEEVNALYRLLREHSS